VSGESRCKESGTGGGEIELEEKEVEAKILEYKAILA
jgi:hypothetical protein